MNFWVSISTNTTELWFTWPMANLLPEWERTPELCHGLCLILYSCGEEVAVMVDTHSEMEGDCHSTDEAFLFTTGFGYGSDAMGCDPSRTTDEALPRMPRSYGFWHTAEAQANCVHIREL